MGDYLERLRVYFNHLDNRLGELENDKEEMEKLFKKGELTLEGKALNQFRYELKREEIQALKDRLYELFPEFKS